MRSIVRFLDRLSDLGARPEDSDVDRLRHGTLIFASMLITLNSMIWVATYFGYPMSAAIPPVPADHRGRAHCAGADAAVRRLSQHTAPRVSSIAGAT
jgi:hypothetical protein